MISMMFSAYQKKVHFMIILKKLFFSIFFEQNRWISPDGFWRGILAEIEYHFTCSSLQNKTCNSPPPEYLLPENQRNSEKSIYLKYYYCLECYYVPIQQKRGVCNDGVRFPNGLSEKTFCDCKKKCQEEVKCKYFSWGYTSNDPSRGKKNCLFHASHTGDVNVDNQYYVDHNFHCYNEHRNFFLSFHLFALRKNLIKPKTEVIV